MGGADGICKGLVDDAARRSAGIDQVMLRFRPIAPKPATDDPGQGGSQVGRKGWPLSGARIKRKYVRVRKTKGSSNCSGSSNNNSSSTKKKRTVMQGPKGKGGPDGSLGMEKQIVTLQLLPEKADHGESKALKAKPAHEHEQEPQCRSIHSCNAHPGPEFGTVNLASPNGVPPMWPTSRSDPINLPVTSFPSPHRMLRCPRVLECWVIVESVADTHIDPQDHHLAGLTDAERIRSLRTDTCPAFLADQSNRVKWVNAAFQEMVLRDLSNDGVDAGQLPTEIVARVVAKQELPKTRAAFGCRATVRQQRSWRREERWAARIVPCDVWRMEEVGGFAWRLDVEAALSLGRN